MKACLMRINYDPKYTSPHLSTSSSVPRGLVPSNNLQSRFSATRQIYNSLSASSSNSEKKLQEFSHQRAKERLKLAVEELNANSDAISPTASQSTLKLPPAGLQTRMISRAMTNINEVNQEKSANQLTESSDFKSVPQVRLMKLVGPDDATVLKPAHGKYTPMLSCSVSASQKLHSSELSKTAQFSKPVTAIYPRHLNQTSISIKPDNSNNNQSSSCLSYLRSKTSLPPECFNFELERRARIEAESAIKNGKVFTVLGPYPSLRASLRRRGWVEKFPNSSSGDGTVSLPKSVLAQISENDLDSENDAPGRRKSEGDILAMMSYYVRNCTPSLVFSVKSVDVISRSIKTSQLVNHFGRASAFTTKAGLCQCLRSASWFEDVDPNSFYPRCFNLGEAEEREAFIDDYRLTACMGLLKYLVDRFSSESCQPTRMTESGDLTNTAMMEGPTSLPLASDLDTESTADTSEKPSGSSSDEERTVEKVGVVAQTETADRQPADSTKYLTIKAVKFAMKQCEKYLSENEHDDIDVINQKETITDEDWAQFLQVYHLFISNETTAVEKLSCLLNSCEELNAKLQQKASQFQLDGYRDIWILKPGAKSRGRGIQCTNRLNEILDAIENSDCSLVAQKYIERPFLIHKTKFDIRQWFLVTDWNPLTMWFYNDCYLRFCSKEFSLDDFHVSIHLSNNSVQKYYIPDPHRSSELPPDNMWTSDEFVEYLRKEGYSEIWKKSIVPGMKNAILCSLLCSQDQVEPRKGSFELFGADFMLDTELKPWLIEINSSPSMARNTRATAKLVDCVMEDTLKVVLDRKSDKSCDVGRFELAYKSQVINDLPHTDPDLSVEGKRIKHRSKKSP